MASVVDICNLALSNVRAGSINSLTESSLQAQVCRLKYPVLRDQLLRDAPWQFARKLEALALTTEDLFNWSYAYQYPSDCVTIRRLILNHEQYAQGTQDRTTLYRDEIYQLQPDPDSQIKYRVFNQDGNKLIAANEPDLRAEYTVGVEDPNLFDPLFIQALSHLLASEVAIPIVGAEKGRKFREDELQIYTAYLNSAIAVDSDEQYEAPPESDFIKIRS
jgi:hypothetical protein